MMKHKQLATMALLMAMGVTSSAQSGGFFGDLFGGSKSSSGGNNKPREFVSVLTSTPAPLSRGRKSQAMLRFKIADGLHINSNKPHSKLLIPTALKLEAPPELKIVNLEYPAGKDFSFDFSPNEKLNVYTGEFAVIAHVQPLKTTKPGSYQLTGELRYQACNDNSCFPPKTIPVNVSVTVE